MGIVFKFCFILAKKTYRISLTLISTTRRFPATAVIDDQANTFFFFFLYRISLKFGSGLMEPNLSLGAIWVCKSFGDLDLFGTSERVRNSVWGKEGSEDVGFYKGRLERECGCVRLRGCGFCVVVIWVWVCVWSLFFFFSFFICVVVIWVWVIGCWVCVLVIWVWVLRCWVWLGRTRRTRCNVLMKINNDK